MARTTRVILPKKSTSPATKSPGRISAKNKASKKKSPPVKTARKQSLGVRTPLVKKIKKESVKKHKKANKNILQEIRFYQSKPSLRLIQKAPFTRAIRTVMNTLCMEGSLEAKRFTSDAIDLIQEVSEMYLVTLCENSNSAVHHAKRVTLMPRDMLLVKKLKGNTDKWEGNK